ncbi:uncharacterized protein K489DRAFT_12585 [Dissoconium aciculare CBS 342.82]|jgi:hypothetical protein|uniref:Uncharacterized protein n=1 Tax=Dissoconium aciculare CBS 342.82 TaxID=1314786 RepID=A0A6J3MH90_9PEZI|nr:uncharacterized protein K489DRAFT_12585 [Dissoconium aciculare CBS 342.82]KAF1827305.1 hypothetical protein K489DRAFT_12585 [Dissoconium aciculare CBS 342.82]
MKVTSVVLGFAPFLLVGFSSSMVIGTPLSLLPEVAQDNATDYVLVEHLSRRGDKKQTHEEFYKNLKKEQHRDKKAFKKAEKKRKKKHLPEPIAEPVDPRLPNITLLIQRYMTYDCQGPVLDPVVIEATAEPVCFEFPTPNKFGSVNVQDGLSEMTWGAAAGPERDAKCKMVTYRNRVCHSKRRMTAYPVSFPLAFPIQHHLNCLG